MKKLTLILIVLFVYSCSTSEKNERHKTKEEIANELADFNLSLENEKIVLISITNNISYKKTYSILKDYEIKLDDIYFDIMTNPNYLIKAIDSISQKNNVSKNITASIIYSYKYNNQ